MVNQPIPFSVDVETLEDDEKSTINGIIKAMSHQSQMVGDREKHTVRASHAKSTGLVTGTIEISPGLAPELAQGLFSKPGKHDVAVRFAQGPGETLSDKVSTHRGMSIKIFDVKGDKLSPDENDSTMDFVFASGPVFPSGTAKGFLRDGKMLETATPLPEMVKSGVASIARTLNSALQAVGTESPLADFFGHPFTSPLSEPYYSQAPIRYGEYVAKLGAFPVEGAHLERLKAETVDTSKDDNGFRTNIVGHFKEEGITFELKAQLWNNKDTQPIENTSVEWSEEESPYRTIATIHLPSQNAYSFERQRYFDDEISYRPGRTLVEHRPLGSVMRARLQVYTALSQYRHERNHISLVEPKSIQDIPA